MPRAKSFYLTDEQRKLIEDNHNLIYAYMHKFNIPEERYDDIAISMCYAAASYVPSKGAFSTYAFKTIHMKLSRDDNWKQKTKKNIPDYMIYSLDDTLSEDGSKVTTFIDMQAAPLNTEDDAIISVCYNNFYNKQSEKNKKMLDLLASGMQKDDIAKAYKCSRKYVDWAQKKLRDNFKQSYAVS